MSVDQILVTVDNNAYPVNVCDRHQAVLKNMFLGAIPASAFGDLDAKTPAKRAVVSKTGKVAKVSVDRTPAKKAAVKKTAAKKTAMKKTTAATRSTTAVKKAAKKSPGRPRKPATR